MLRSVATLLARTSGGDYCIADTIDESGVLRRLEIVHADASRAEKLRVRTDEARLDPRGRVGALLARGGSELIPKVGGTARGSTLADIALIGPERVSSYMATAIAVAGSPLAVLTMASVRERRRYDKSDLGLLEVVGDWTGLGLENALRRQLQPRESVAPPPGRAASAVHERPRRLRLGG